MSTENQIKTVVITGASKGIGYATALEFASSGHRVLAIARNRSLLNELRSASGSRVEILVSDITDSDLPDLIKQETDKIDILIHNAGYLINQPFSEISMDELRMVYEINVFAPFVLTQKLRPLFSKTAHIIMIGSVGGVNGTVKFPGLTAYSSSKAALGCLAECLQEEYKDTSLSFNCLALGSVQTEMLEEAFPGYKAPVSSMEMGKYISQFALDAVGIVKGKTTLLSSSNP